MNSPAPAASAFFRSWRDLEALIATKGWGVRASPAIGDGADVLYFVPPPGDTPTVQVRHLGKAMQASVWALRGSAGSMLSLDPVTAAQVEARPHQWRVEAMVPDHPTFPTRDSFTLVCGDVLVALGLMDPVAGLGEPVDPLADALAQVEAPPRETAVDALQRRVAAMAALDFSFAVHDAGYSPDDFPTPGDVDRVAAYMDELDAADAVTDARALATLERHGFSPDDFDTWDTLLACAQAFDAMTDSEAAKFTTLLGTLDPITGDNVTARASMAFTSLVQEPVSIAVDLGSGADMTAYAYQSTTDGQVKAWDGTPPYPADHPLRERVAAMHTRAQFGMALMAARRRRPAAQRFREACAALWTAWCTQVGSALAWAYQATTGGRR